ncbi:DUF5677 domain-containing protein [Terriglobus sp. ADX1]|uniref:DUF5677 domain-containing protein n=1 Tax=Terriglobus sp. ADX1 TaxID=2794063 RepID=UPI002FE5BDB3
MTETEVIEYIALASDFIAELRSQLNDLGVVRRVAHRYPFDHLAFELLSKTFSLCDACLSLIRDGWCNEAYGLSRSIVECALTLRYITAVPDLLIKRTMKFASASKADRRLWLHFAQAEAQSEPEKQHIARYAAEWGLYPDTKAAYDHWSGERSFAKAATEVEHPLDPSDADIGYKRIRRAFDYYYTSHFVHCSQTAMDYSKVLDGDLFAFRDDSTERVPAISERCITLLISYSKQVTSYAIYGMGIVVPSTFTVLEKFIFSREVGRFIRKE